MADHLPHPLAGYHAGSTAFFSIPPEFYANPDRHESRGVLWTWELPRRDATYVLGCDPTVGITNWNIWNKTRDDRAVDNCAIEVIRKGKIKIITTGNEKRAVREPDVQVAEFAAPIDYKDCAGVINAIGKMYRGDAEDEGCLVIWEMNNSGLAVAAELQKTIHYTNLFMQEYLDTILAAKRASYGFWSDAKSKMLLWTKGIRLMAQGGLVINSPWLLEELKRATANKFLDRTLGPKHDDRLTATLLTLWAAHQWTFDADDYDQTPLQPIAVASTPDNQRRLVTASVAQAIDADRFSTLLEGFDKRNVESFVQEIEDTPSKAATPTERGLDVFG